MWYALDENKKPYPINIKDFATFAENMDIKVVQQDKLDDEIFVSTVFLFLDHGWGDRNDPEYKPVLWETMIFNGEHDGYQERYRSYEDAVEGHKKALELAKTTKQHE